MPKINLPEVPGTLDYEGPWAPNEGLQTRQMLHATLMNIRQFEDEILDEIGGDSGTVKVTILPSNRVLISQDPQGGQFCAYMADPHVDSRLVLDDYIPELAE